MERAEYIQVVDTYADMVYRVAYSYCRTGSDAEDVVQNVFLKLLESDTEFQDVEHLRKWLIRVAANESKNLCTSFWKRHMVPLEISDSAFQYEFPYRECSELYDAVRKLPGKYSIVVLLYYYEEYAVKEIAELLQIKETTVQTRLMRARQKLKAVLKEDWKDEQ